MTQGMIPTLACALLIGSAEGFMAPSAARTQARTPAATTTMSLQSHKASAAAFLAGVISLGGVMDVAAPANAAIFDQSAPALQRDVGFGQPGALDDSSNNNAASGKENGSKYDIQQQGEFAKQNSAGAVDYGSAKGTDFGKTAGGKQGVATETKATDGDFLVDAKQNTREGTKIAPKNTNDAANVDFSKDVRTSGKGTLGDGMESAKKAVTGGASSSSAKWAGVVDASQNAQAKANAAQSKSWTTGPANTAKVPEKSLNNGFTAAFRPKPAGAAEIEDIGRSANRAGQDLKNQAKGAVKDVSRATSDLRDENVNASLTGKAGGELGSAQRNPQGKAQKDLSNTQRAAKNAVPRWAGGEVSQAKNNPQGKVNKDLSRAKGAAQDALPNSVADAASSAKNALPNWAGGEVSQAKNNPEGKVNKDLSRAKGAAQDALPNNVADAASSAKSAAQDAVSGNPLEAAANKVKSVASNTVGDAIKDSGVVEKGSPASTLLSLNEPEGGIALSTDPAKAAQVSGQKTVDKVRSDIDTARANPPFQDNSAGSAVNSAKGSLNQGQRKARSAWQYGQQSARKAGKAIERTGKEFSLANLGGGGAKGEVKKAANNPRGKVNADVRQAQRAADNAGNAIQSKVSNDIKTAQRATPDAPKVGGLFGTNPKRQADVTGQKTASKVASDVNAVKKGLLN